MPQRMHSRNCRDCGRTFNTRWTASIRCDACHEARLTGAANQRLCARCSESFGAAGRARLCLKCRTARDSGKRRETHRLQFAANGEYRDRRRSQNRAWARRNTDRLSAYKRAWKERNRDHVRTYKRQYERTARLDHRNKLLAAMRSRVATALRAAVRKGKPVTDRGAMRLVGCSVAELMMHLESQFGPGMTWENFGRTGWHVDHIYPVGRADLSDGAHVRAAFSWMNCRPAWGDENLKKNARVSRGARALFDCLVAHFRAAGETTPPPSPPAAPPRAARAGLPSRRSAPDRARPAVSAARRARGRAPP